MRREYQTAVEWKCEEAREKGYMSGEDVEKAWTHFYASRAMGMYVPIATAQYNALSFPEEPGDVQNRYGLQ